MRITGFVKENCGTNHYRVAMPLNKLDQYRLADTQLYYHSGEFVITKSMEDRLLSSDIVVLGNPSGSLLELVKLLQDNKVRVVADYDDNYFAVEPQNPAYRDYGTKEFPGAWKDKENFDIEANLARLEAIRQIAAQADLVTVVGPALSEVFAPLSKKIAILTHGVDLPQWKPVQPEERKKIRLYWTGGTSHEHDLNILIEPLRIILNRHPNVEFRCMGYTNRRFAGALAGLDYEYIQTVHVEAYPYKVAQTCPDIALIPLLNSEHNRSKTFIKWVEMSALKIPAVVSSVIPYTLVCNKKNAVMVENTTQAWVNGIEELLWNKEWQRSLAHAAFEKVVRDHDMNHIYMNWFKTYRELIGG